MRLTFLHLAAEGAQEATEDCADAADLLRPMAFSIGLHHVATVDPYRWDVAEQNSNNVDQWRSIRNFSHHPSTPNPVLGNHGYARRRAAALNARATTASTPQEQQR